MSERRAFPVLAWGLAGALIGLVASCTCMGPGFDDFPFLCGGDDQCAPGWVCRHSQCVQADAGCAAALEICGDGLENDCDDLIDCADDDCDGGACNASGWLCQAAQCLCPPVGQDGGLPPEASCSNGIDDDCDLLADCADPDCLGRACNSFGHACTALGTCECPPPGDGGFAPEAVCDDGIDNDCNTLKDCADPSCAGRSCGIAGSTCVSSLCACADAGTAPELPEQTCGDGLDNDCNGQPDCADLASCVGQTCGPNGNACTNNSGVGACTCSGNGGTAQPGAETICGDNADNDCDGLEDCQEPACNGQTCGTFGRLCNGTSCACGGNGGPAESPEASCADGFDNDCDGLVDCADPSCVGDACGPYGWACGGGLCNCSGNGGSSQDGGETICNDTKDNDCDNRVDCLDVSTCATRTCGANGMTCAGDGGCACSGNGGTPQPGGETICNDGVNNDCDAFTDCQESSCAGQTCGLNGRTCSGTSCTCSGNGGPAEQPEASCGDGRDNDCDGVADCADSDCLLDRCGPSSFCCTTSSTGCKDIAADPANCGGCGIGCRGAAPACEGATLPDAGLTGRCTCGGNGDCPDLGGTPATRQRCQGGGGVCECTDSVQCGAGQTCTLGPSYLCSY